MTCDFVDALESEIFDCTLACYGVVKMVLNMKRIILSIVGQSQECASPASASLCVTENDCPEKPCVYQVYISGPDIPQTMTSLKIHTKLGAQTIFLILGYSRIKCSIISDMPESCS